MFSHRSTRASRKAKLASRPMNTTSKARKGKSKKKARKWPCHKEKSWTSIKRLRLEVWHEDIDEDGEKTVEPT
jgi:hypothetical protein